MRSVFLSLALVLAPVLAFAQASQSVRVVEVSSISVAVVEQFQAAFPPLESVPLVLAGDLYQALLAFAIIMGVTAALR